MDPIADQPVDVRMSSSSMTSIQNVAVPVVMVFLIAGAVVSGVLWINGQFESARADIAGVKADVKALQQRLSEPTWTMHDMRMWARALESQNAGVLKGVPPVE